MVKLKSPCATWRRGSQRKTGDDLLTERRQPQKGAVARDGVAAQQPELEKPRQFGVLRRHIADGAVRLDQEQIFALFVIQAINHRASPPESWPDAGGAPGQSRVPLFAERTAG